MEIKHSSRDALEFLRRWSENGPWVLTAIIPDGVTDTCSFDPEDAVACERWIEERQNKKNIYFHVNPTKKMLYSKASKEDIARMAWLHIDIDPRAGEDLEDERVRALKVLTQFDKKPTVIIDSGGGYQGFWRLQEDERLEIGTIDQAIELEAYNRQLEKIFQGDHCHNIDRIMRLPGTVNIPTNKKKKKGRKAVVAELIEFNDFSYELDQFTPAVQVQTSSGAGLTGDRPQITITGNVPDIGTEELSDWARENNKNISDHCLALIATGQDPLDPTKYPSRSEALFKVCIDLVRAEVPDEMIFAVLTGSNEIATSVREKPNWEAYALRQIQRAHEEAIDPMLRKLNEKHAVIADMGGKCRIISEVWDTAMKRSRISKQSFEDFRNRYRHIKVVVGHSEKGQEITKAAGAFWIDNPSRRQYETVVFAPGQEVAESYNMWRGFSCDSLPGNKHQSFLDHIFLNVCSGNQEHYKYLLGWMARLVQVPDCPGEVAVVIRGKRGTGKGFFIKALGQLFGRHFLQVSDPKHLVGSFNAHLRDTVLLFGDEAFFAGDKKHESVLKMLVTEEILVVEGKGVDVEVSPNYVHLFLASNEDWVVPAGLDERRFFVMQMGEEKKQDHAYFKGLKKDLDNGGLQNLLDYLMNYDLSEYEVRQVPQTAALQEQKIMSMPPEVQWLFDKIMDGRMLKRQDAWPEKVPKDPLYEDYIKDLRDQGRNYRMSKIQFGKFLSTAFPGQYPESKQETCDVPYKDESGMEMITRKRIYFYYLPDLAATRKHWDEQFGGPFDWPVIAEPEEESKKAPIPF